MFGLDSAVVVQYVLKIFRRLDGGVAVLDLTGCLMVSPGEVELSTLRSMIRDLIDTGRLELVIDLSGLTHLDARGLGELAMVMKTLQTCGGHLTLKGASPKIARMLAVTRLDTVFQCCEAEREVAV